MKNLLTLTSFSFIQISFFPNLNLLSWSVLAMLIDLATGMIKAIVKKQPRTSKKLQESIYKLLQYMGAILAAAILVNITPPDQPIISYLADGLLIFIIYIEILSIFENLQAIDSQSLFAKYFIGPFIRILTFSIKKKDPNWTEKK